MLENTNTELFHLTRLFQIFPFWFLLFQTENYFGTFFFQALLFHLFLVHQDLFTVLTETLCFTASSQFFSRVPSLTQPREVSLLLSWKSPLQAACLPRHPWVLPVQASVVPKIKRINGSQRPSTSLCKAAWISYFLQDTDSSRSVQERINKTCLSPRLAQPGWSQADKEHPENWLNYLDWQYGVQVKKEQNLCDGFYLEVR